MNSWIRDAIVYHIYPFGFCGTPRENNFLGNSENRIKQVESLVPHIKTLGINTIYFGPIFESTSHGYDTADYYHIDRRLGTNEDFEKVSKTLHENGIRVILDGVFNHVGRDFWAFKDVIKNGQSSLYCDWFCKLNFACKSPYGDAFSYDGWEGNYNLVKLNLRNSDVRNHIFNAIKVWYDEFGIDGLRLDVAYCMDRNFLKELSLFCRNLNKDFFLLGEMIHGDYNAIVNDEMLDSSTNYECYKGLHSSHNTKNYFEIAYAYNRQFGKGGGIYRGKILYNFVDNHDVNRIASILNNPEHLKLVYTLLFTMPGLPSIYYGSEFGIKGEKVGGSDDGIRPKLNLDELLKDKKALELNSFISKLANIRLNSKALKYGEYSQLEVKNEQFAFVRQLEGEFVITAVNLSPIPYNMTLQVPEEVGLITNLLNKEQTFEVVDKKCSIQIPAYGTLILK